MQWPPVVRVKSAPGQRNESGTIWGVGNNGARNGVRPSSLLNIAGRGKGVGVTITDRMAAWRRDRRVLLRVSRAAWRLEQAERERSWALASARAEGVSIRTLAAAAGLSPARVHQITAGADLDGLDAVLGELRPRAGPRRKTPAERTMPSWMGAT